MSELQTVTESLDAGAINKKKAESSTKCNTDLLN